MFSSLREYRLCDFVMDKLDRIRRGPSILFTDQKEVENLDYLGSSEFTYINGDDIITLNKDGRSIMRNGEDISYCFNWADMKVSGSYRADYFGKGNMSISYLDWDGCVGGNIKNSYIYLSNIESMKSPYEQMDQLDVLFKIVMDNPNCKVFFSTVSPYVVNYFNVNLLRYYEELGDKFSYYQFNDEMDKKTGRINIWKLNAVDNKSGRNFASTMDHSDIMEVIIDEYRYERELYNKRNNIEQK